MMAVPFSFEFSNGEGCYSKLSGKSYRVDIPIRFTIWGAIQSSIFPEARVPGFSDSELLEEVEKGNRYKLFAGKKEEGYTGSVEVIICCPPRTSRTSAQPA
jgi:hypothetical protein